jgi:DNA-binding winged helix-turn-helix (wHTH) protein
MALHFDRFTLDVDARQLLLDGRDIHLTPKAFDLLAFLASQAPRVVPKAELHARLWPETFVADATLVGLIKELRRALDDTSASPIIRTVHRVGYAIAREVSGAPSGASAIVHWITAGTREYPLAPGDHVIGRERGADLCFEAPSVSRRHARIAVSGDVATISDLGSRNGTTVNATAVTRPTPLHIGDQIAIGDVEIVYHAAAIGSEETRPIVR